MIDFLSRVPPLLIPSHYVSAPFNNSSFCPCLQVNCRGYNAFGRRRRREISKNNEPDDDALESVQRGQLREEITIESNAILTFERREERLMDPTEGTLYNIISFGYYNMHLLL